MSTPADEQYEAEFEKWNEDRQVSKPDADEIIYETLGRWIATGSHQETSEGLRYELAAALIESLPGKEEDLALHPMIRTGWNGAIDQTIKAINTFFGIKEA